MVRVITGGVTLTLLLSGPWSSPARDLGPAAGFVARGLAPPAGDPQPAPVGAQDEDEDPALTKAKALFAAGRARFETADFAGAVDLWTQAYGVLPPEGRYARIKAELIYDIANAQEMAFEVDKDTRRFEQARLLLESYDAIVDEIYEDRDTRVAEHANVEKRLARLRERLAQASAGDDGGETDTGAVQGPRKRPKPGTVEVAVGGVALGLAAGGVGMLAAGAVIGGGANDLSDLAPDDIEGRRAQFDRGRMGNTLVIVGASVVTIGAVAGAVLISVGVRKRRAAADVPSAAMVPWALPGAAGLTLSGRF